MRVLVTGGAGFIGSHLTESLFKDGHQVVIADNFSTSTPDQLFDLYLPKQRIFFLFHLLSFLFYLSRLSCFCQFGIF